MARFVTMYIGLVLATSAEAVNERMTRWETEEGDGRVKLGVRGET